MFARVVCGDSVCAETLDTRDHLIHFARDETAGIASMFLLLNCGVRPIRVCNLLLTGFVGASKT